MSSMASSSPLISSLLLPFQRFVATDGGDGINERRRPVGEVLPYSISYCDARIEYHGQRRKTTNA